MKPNSCVSGNSSISLSTSSPRRRGSGRYLIYLSSALEENDPGVLLAAVGHAAKARGMSTIAQGSGLGRESLYKAFVPCAKPGYKTVQKVLHPL